MSDLRPALEIESLNATFETDAGPVRAVRDLSLSLQPGRTLGLVGESGSGKSVTSLAIMGLLPEVGARVQAARLCVLGRDVLHIPKAERQAMRGRDLAMVFQEPMTSLNPVLRVGEQVAEAIRQHQHATRAEARARVLDLLSEVGLPDPARLAHAYPHQLSGGQKQRAMIAMALSCNPQLLIADEPTTALDVTIQAQVLALLHQLQARRGMAMLFITHDLGVIAQVADEVAVMYRGEIVESGSVRDVFRAPRHPYTRGLLHCRPRLEFTGSRLPTIADFVDSAAPAAPCPPRPAPPVGEAPVLSVTDLRVHFPVRSGVLQRVTGHVRAVDGVSFDVHRGRTLGLVGESGCGKTTTGRAILRLVEPTSGGVRFLGHDFLGLRGEPLRRLRRELQVVFQDPYSSLNPRMSVRDHLVEPMQVHGIGASVAEREHLAVGLLREVGLAPEHLARFPHEFSGGQRQRICIARALSVSPSLLICDESVSALDVSVQAQVLNLLKDLQDQRGLTCIFISHDLSVVKFMADEIAVMRAGVIVEMGPSESIYQDPKQDYTRQLIAAIPRGGAL